MFPQWPVVVPYASRIIASRVELSFDRHRVATRRIILLGLLVALGLISVCVLSSAYSQSNDDREAVRISPVVTTTGNSLFESDSTKTQALTGSLRSPSQV